jgi:YhcH/YjgK/YiaL family protein
MIIISLKNVEHELSQFEFGNEVSNFISNLNRQTFNLGRVDISDKAYALFLQGECKTSAAKLEVHKRYADIHIPIHYSDVIATKDFCIQNINQYSESEDYQLFDDIPTHFTKLNLEQACVILPFEYHSALNFNGNYNKVVIKVKYG